MGRRTGDGDKPHDRDHPGWAMAKDAFQQAFASDDPQTIVDVGRVHRVGRGLFRSAWVAEITVRPDPSGLSGEWVASIPHEDAEADPELPARVAREARLLSWLQSFALPFRVPRSVPPVDDVLLSEWVPGMPLEGKVYGTKHRETFLAVAPVLHALAPPDFLPGFDTRRAHALDAIAQISRLEDPVARDLRDQALAHLPPDTPSALLHGDLLGQNLLFHFELPPAVVDWSEASRGDPAYDLAIVTRGRRRPFGDERGTEDLVEAYRATGAEITLAQVRIHELAMLATRVCTGPAEEAGDTLGQLRRLAREVLGSADRGSGS